MRIKKKLIVFLIIFFMASSFLIPFSLADVSVNETPEITIDTTFEPFDDDQPPSGTSPLIQPTSPVGSTIAPTTVQTTSPTTKQTTPATTVPATPPTTEIPVQLTTRTDTAPEPIPPAVTIEPVRTRIDPSTASFQDLYLHSFTSKWVIFPFIGILVLAGIAYYYYRRE